MILLKSIQLNNFLSHENTILNFSESEKLLLDGRSGSGKSSISEAIIWCLYGKGRSNNVNLIRRGSKGASVSLKLRDGSTETIITRSISNSKNALNVTRNIGEGGKFLPIETTGLKDTQNWIEETFLHASFELFTNSIAYPQENENSFVKANASRRKDLLLEIVRAGNFDELYEKTRKTISNMELENAVNLSKISSLEESIKRNTEIYSHLELYKKIYDDTSYKLGGLETEEKDLESYLNDISNATNQINNNKRIIQVLSDSIISTDTQIYLNDKEIEEYNKIDPEVFKKDIIESEKLSQEAEIIEQELKESADLSSVMYNHMANKPQVFDYTKDIKEINERLVPLIKDSGKCPAGDACPWIEPIRGQIIYLKEQLIDRENKSKKEEKDLYGWKLTQTTLSPIKDTTDLYNKLKDIQTRIHFISTSKDKSIQYLLFKDGLGELNVKQLSLRMKRQKNAQEVIENEEIIKHFEEQLKNLNVNKVNLDLSNLRLTKQETQKTRDEASINKQIAINAEKEVKDASTSLLETQDIVKKVNENLESLQLLKEALSSTGIKATVVDYILPPLEDKINEILSQLSDFRIRLDTQQPKADPGEGNKEGLWIIVKNDQGQEMSFESFSGGEKVKITIAISEALASLQSSIGFRIMDENIISLDKESTESFIEVLNKLQNNFPQLLIISHIDSIKDLFEKKIEIKKINGISKINI